VSAPVPEGAFDLEEILAGLERWVRIKSPTMDRDGVNRMMDVAGEAMASLGAEVERHPGRDGYGDAVVAKTPSASGLPGILVLCHLDTVHADGSFPDERVFHREGGRIFGPGILDMKGGAFLACHGLRLTVEHSGPTPLPITFIFVPDEEVGSPTSRALIEAEALQNRYVLVPEPAQDGLNLITGRWAFQRFTVRARGRPAHAGATLESGSSAIREIAEQIVRIEEMSDHDRKITFSVGTVDGGSFVNVVPERCDAEVLVVTAERDVFDHARAAITSLEPRSADVRLEIEAGPVRPLFAPTPDGLALYEHARSLARRIGFDPGHGSVGGGSDGNFTGSLGVPTLDGLGPRGDGFHTPTEHVRVSSLVPRARLLAELFRTLS
jgi:glutamate carboxypeptidase